MFTIFILLIFLYKRNQSADSLNNSTNWFIHKMQGPNYVESETGVS